jgi:uncharacterized protein (DUF433 family)
MTSLKFRISLNFCPNFVAPDQICLKDQPIGIEQVLLYYLKGYGPEEIAEQFPAFSLDQVNATIVYCRQNQAKIDGYLASLKTWQESDILNIWPILCRSCTGSGH